MGECILFVTLVWMALLFAVNYISLSVDEKAEEKTDGVKPFVDYKYSQKGWF